MAVWHSKVNLIRLKRRIDIFSLIKNAKEMFLQDLRVVSISEAIPVDQGQSNRAITISGKRVYSGSS